ncbi:Bis(5'-nucleosyl)-tetraphosphatase (asymmetrical) [hydrothermal vent metagenome]|uniref:Bis(5'-nucleosyl)-tetraphosphatase (Asymmetrical) n=1 Tax=hydrothermal vent metagenome TaxID=652676 RepID=A0A3B1AVY5_9ZZZZ
MSDCLFCKIVAGEIPADKVYEDELVVVFRDINPKAKVHLLIVPREHIVGLNELESEHGVLIGHIMGLIHALAVDQGLESGYRTIINTGRDGGQEVFHLHIHLLGGRDLPGFG